MASAFIFLCLPLSAPSFLLACQSFSSSHVGLQVRKGGWRGGGQRCSPVYVSFSGADALMSRTTDCLFKNQAWLDLTIGNRQTGQFGGLANRSTTDEWHAMVNTDQLNYARKCASYILAFWWQCITCCHFYANNITQGYYVNRTEHCLFFSSPNTSVLNSATWLTGRDVSTGKYEWMSLLPFCLLYLNLLSVDNFICIELLLLWLYFWWCNQIWMIVKGCGKDSITVKIKHQNANMLSLVLAQHSRMQTWLVQKTVVMETVNKGTVTMMPPTEAIPLVRTG